jgi:hypothetical protein
MKIPATDSPLEAAYCALWNAEHASTSKRHSIMFIGLAMSALDRVVDVTAQSIVLSKTAEVQRKLALSLSIWKG